MRAVNHRSALAVLSQKVQDVLQDMRESFRLMISSEKEPTKLVQV